MDKTGNENNLETGALETGAHETGGAVQDDLKGSELGHALDRASDRGGIVTARGTVDGVILRLDGRINRDSLFTAIEEFLSTRESFLGGSEVALEWVGAKPEDVLMNDLSAMLAEKFKITVKSSKLKEHTRTSAVSLSDVSLSENSTKATAGKVKTRSLFDGIEAINQNFAADMEGDFERPAKRGSGASPGFMGGSAIGSSGAFWDEADGRVVYATLRSGQRIETDHSIVIFGDINSGAEVVAGGDIIVLGTLRGVAHAGAYDETGGGRVIFALNLQPTQLRIGMVISRSSNDSSQRTPEIAKVEDGMIVVEPYSVKNLSKKL